MSILAYALAFLFPALFSALFFLALGLLGPAAGPPARAAAEARPTADRFEREQEKSVAVVKCGGRRGLAARAFEYGGHPSCAIASRYFGGGPECRAACVGFGDCAAACPVGAIKVEEGLATVRPERCTGCGLCVAACPKGLVEIVPNLDAWYVACSSQEPEGPKASACKAACTACRICEHHSVHGEFSLKANLAAANYACRQGSWASIAERCPSAAIKAVRPKNSVPATDLAKKVL